MDSMSVKVTASVGASNAEKNWYALYTRPRFEKKVNEALQLKDLHSFLPVRTVIRMWSNGKKKIEEPLFPSYVFIKSGTKEQYQALKTYGVCRFVGFNGRPSRIPDAQIQAIQHILEQNHVPKPHEYLNRGDLVEIVDGPLAGMRGFYVEDRGVGRLVITVDAIMQSIAVEVERDFVKKIRSAERRNAFS